MKLPLPNELDQLRSAPGNVLRPHGREAALHVALRFSEGGEARDWLAAISSELSSAYGELERSATKQSGPVANDDGIFRLLALSRSGYERATINRSFWPSSPAWLAGMAARGNVLNDPGSAEWERQYRGGIDALLIIAHDDLAVARLDFRRLFNRTQVPGVSVIAVEVGQRIYDEYGSSIEHFGYVDGISQPRFFSGEVERDEARNRTSEWPSGFAPSAVMVPCPSSDRMGCGSFLVYRKLEQDVQSFKKAEIALAAELELSEDSRDLAGGMLLGRMIDGRPVQLLEELPSAVPIENGFSFSGDFQGCPMSSHIRKMNPRTQATRDQVMARRGVPYGSRDEHPLTSVDIDSYPAGGVGLLFLAFMANIERQFETVQLRANDSQRGRYGSDPIIGQREATNQRWRAGSSGRETELNFGGYVGLRGGEYLYAPSLDLFDRIAVDRGIAPSERWKI